MKPSIPRRPGALAAAIALTALCGAAILPAPAAAACVCRCVDGKAKAVCASSTDIPPLCNATACPMTPPKVSPTDALKPKPTIKPGCTVKKVYDPKTGQYEWAQLCQ